MFPKNGEKIPELRFPEFTGDWEQRKLGEITGKVIGGGTPKTCVSEYWDGDIPWIQSSNVQENEMFDFDIPKSITQEGLEKSAAKLVPENSIAVVTHVGVGKLVFVPFSYTTSQDFTSLSELKTDAQFTCYSLYQRIKNDLHIVQGSAIKGITKDDLLSKEIMVPEIQEQRKIGNYFRKLDNLITLHQRQCEVIKKQKQFFLQNMFPKEGESSPKIRFKGFSDSWKQCKLHEICSMNARIGWQNLRTSEFLDSGDYLLITGTDFVNGKVNFKSCHYVDKYRFDQDLKIQVQNGSILITKDGTLGKVAIIEALPKPATLNAGVFNVVIKSKDIDNYYLYQYLKAPFLMNYVNKRSTGGTIKHLNQSILVDFPVLKPSLQEQQKIGAYFERLDNLITLHQRQYEQLVSLKKYLLTKMFI